MYVSENVGRNSYARYSSNIFYGRVATGLIGLYSPATLGLCVAAQQYSISRMIL